MQLLAKLKKNLCMGFRATLNFRKFKVALNPMYRNVFQIKALTAEIKGVFSRSYCCYGNLLCHENNTNVFTSDWAVF